MPPSPKKKQRHNTPIILAIASDLHAGSTVGLCPPVFTLDDGGTYKASPAQRWLWRCWLDYIGQVQAIAASHGAGYTVVINGDAIEGNHHHTTQVISNNETTQMRIAEAALSPLLQDADMAYFVRGTPAHVGGQARLEERIAENYTNTVQDGDNFTRWHLSLDANGTLFDIGHHGAIGRLPWTRANGVNRIASQAIIAAHQGGYRSPNVILRAHWHQYADTGTNYNGLRVIAMPAWQLVTGYVNKLQPGALADIGGLIFICYPGGKYDLEVVRFMPKPTTPERLRT
jgi:hypothetical protein